MSKPRSGLDERPITVELPPHLAAWLAAAAELSHRTPETMVRDVIASEKRRWDADFGAAGSGLPIAGRTPTFRHLDDPGMTWQQCRRQRNADGSESSVWEKWLSFSADPPYLSLYARYDPGMIVRRHGHLSPHVVFVIEGELWVGDTHCPAGTHIELPFGAAFGPIRAGDAGARLFEVMLGDPRSWGDQPERFEQALAEHGATALPDVELDYPDWLQDLRQHWAGAADVTDDRTGDR